MDYYHEKGPWANIISKKLGTQCWEGTSYTFIKFVNIHVWASKPQLHFLLSNKSALFQCVLFFHRLR